MCGVETVRRFIFSTSIPYYYKEMAQKKTSVAPRDNRSFSMLFLEAKISFLELLL